MFAMFNIRCLLLATVATLVTTEPLRGHPSAYQIAAAEAVGVNSSTAIGHMNETLSVTCTLCNIPDDMDNITVSWTRLDTSTWVEAERNVFIDLDLEGTALEIRTNSAAGSNESMGPCFYNSLATDRDDYFSYVDVFFEEEVTVKVKHCINKTTITVPPEQEKVWRITKSPTALKIECNGEEVYDLVYADHSAECVTAWSNDVAKMLFYPPYDTASDQYKKQLHKALPIEEETAGFTVSNTPQDEALVSKLTVDGTVNTRDDKYQCDFTASNGSTYSGVSLIFLFIVTPHGADVEKGASAELSCVMTDIVKNLPVTWENAVGEDVSGLPGFRYTTGTNVEGVQTSVLEIDEAVASANYTCTWYPGPGPEPYHTTVTLVVNSCSTSRGAFQSSLEDC